jgi:lipid II:glycine glycyltransferase (peptidoglycan interpeptide bridge formation enzyme)
MRLGGYDGLVENMPAATIMIDLSQSEESLLSDMAGRTRTQIRKAQQYGLRVEIASLNDRDVYYDMWVETGDTK